MQLMLAWAAGFFDGEGYVGFIKSSGRFRQLRASIAQVDRRPLDAFVAAVGIGKVRGPYGPRSVNRKQYFQWAAQGQCILLLEERLGPFLKLKHDQFIGAVSAWRAHVDESPARRKVQMSAEKAVAIFKDDRPRDLVAAENGVDVSTVCRIKNRGTHSAATAGGIAPSSS